MQVGDGGIAIIGQSINRVVTPTSNSPDQPQVLLEFEKVSVSMGQVITAGHGDGSSGGLLDIYRDAFGNSISVEAIMTEVDNGQELVVAELRQSAVGDFLH